MKQFLSPAAALNYSLFLGAVKDAREFHSALMNYKRLNWTKAAASARGSRNTYLRRARRYLDRVLDTCIDEAQEVMDNPPTFATDLAQAYRSAYPADRYKKE